MPSQFSEVERIADEMPSGVSRDISIAMAETGNDFGFQFKLQDRHQLTFTSDLGLAITFEPVFFSAHYVYVDGIAYMARPGETEAQQICYGLNLGTTGRVISSFAISDEQDALALGFFGAVKTRVLKIPNVHPIYRHPFLKPEYDIRHYAGYEPKEKILVGRQHSFRFCSYNPAEFTVQ